MSVRIRIIIYFKKAPQCGSKLQNCKTDSNITGVFRSSAHDHTNIWHCVFWSVRMNPRSSKHVLHHPVSTKMLSLIRTSIRAASHPDLSLLMKNLRLFTSHSRVNRVLRSPLCEKRGTCQTRSQVLSSTRRDA